MKPKENKMCTSLRRIKRQIERKRVCGREKYNTNLVLILQKQINNSWQQSLPVIINVHFGSKFILQPPGQGSCSVSEPNREKTKKEEDEEERKKERFRVINLSKVKCELFGQNNSYTIRWFWQFRLPKVCHNIVPGKGNEYPWTNIQLIRLEK